LIFRDDEGRVIDYRSTRTYSLDCKKWDIQRRFGCGHRYLSRSADPEACVHAAAHQEKEAAMAAKQLQEAWSQVEDGAFQGTAADLRNRVSQTQQAESATTAYGGSVAKAGEEAIAILNDLRQQWQEVADTTAARNADLRAQLLELNGDQGAADKLRLAGELTRDLSRVAG